MTIPEARGGCATKHFRAAHAVAAASVGLHFLGAALYVVRAYDPNRSTGRAAWSLIVGLSLLVAVLAFRLKVHPLTRVLGTTQTLYAFLLSVGATVLVSAPGPVPGAAQVVFFVAAFPLSLLAAMLELPCWGWAGAAACVLLGLVLTLPAFQQPVAPEDLWALGSLAVPALLPVLAVCIRGDRRQLDLFSD